MSARPRLLVTTDIGGDPDDQQSLVRLLMYSNELRVEGLCPTSSGIIGQKEDPLPCPHLIHQQLNAYEQIRPNLLRHADGWPEADALRAVAHAGRTERGREVIGEEHDTAASRWIIERVDAGSPEDPLNISIWGGQTDFAQALWRVKQSRGGAGLADFVSRLRVYDIGDQDKLAEWMRIEFPGMHYVLAKSPPGVDRREATFRGMYLGGDESTTSRDWVDANIRSQGPLGALYPTETWTKPNPHGCLKEGDTPSWFFFLPRGGNDPSDPTQPGWGGQFRPDGDGWFIDLPLDRDPHPRETVSRHRPAFQADFASRMRWCAS